MDDKWVSRSGELSGQVVPSPPIVDEISEARTVTLHPSDAASLRSVAGYMIGYWGEDEDSTTLLRVADWIDAKFGQ